MGLNVGRVKKKTCMVGFIWRSVFLVKSRNNAYLVRFTEWWCIDSNRGQKTWVKVLRVTLYLSSPPFWKYVAQCHLFTSPDAEEDGFTLLVHLTLHQLREAFFFFYNTVTANCLLCEFVIYQFYLNALWSLWFCFCEATGHCKALKFDNDVIHHI